MQQNLVAPEIHKLKISVAVSHVHLLVRFPCRLSFQLKTDQSQVQTVNTYQLKKGQCQIDETISFEVNFKYNPQSQTYEDKKIKLTVMMSSANGIIPAGLINFNPCNKNNQEKAEYTFSLEKCPDRAAQITFTQWYQFVGISTSNIYQSNLLDGKYANNSYNKTQLKMSTLTNSNQANFSKNLKYSPAKQRDLSPNNMIGTPRSRVRTYTSPVFEQNIQTSSYQPNFGGYENRLSQSYSQQQRQVQGYQNYRNNPVTQSHYGNNIGNLNQNSPSMMNINDSKMEYSEKAYYLKQIAKLKGEVKTLQNQDKWEQLIRVKDQNESLSLEIQKHKQKCRNLQKKDRQYNISIKQLKDQIQRLKIKLTQSDSLKNQYDLSSLDKQKKLKESVLQIKSLQEKITDMNLSITSYQKKIQFKEASFQQQIKKMTQKYNQSETQRQKTTYEYNLLLGKMEQSQKKNQLLAKDKQRLNNDEKNKLNKKIQGLNQQYEKVKEELSDKINQLADLSLNFKNLQKKESQLQASSQQLQNQLDYSNSALKKEEQQRKTFQKQIQILRVAEQERNNLKKKYNEIVGELSRTNQKLQKLTNQFNTISNKAKQQEQTIKQRNKEKSSLSSKINILTKQIEEIRKEQEKIAKQSQALSAQNMNSNQRINDLRTKLQTQQRESDQIIMRYEEQISYLTKSKEYSDNQVEDLRWSLQKQKQQYDDLCCKFKQANQDILNTNKDLLQANDRIKRLQIDISESSSSIKCLTGQKVRLQAKERELLQMIKTKTTQNYEQNKKKIQIQQQIYLLKQKLSQSTANFNDKQNSDEKQFKEKEKEIHLLHQELTKLKMDLLQKDEDLNSQLQTINLRNNEINHLKDSNQNLNNQINQLEIKNQQTRQQLKNAQFQLKNTKIQLENTKTALTSASKELQKLKRDWEQYRTNTTKALQQLIIEISKDEDSSNSKQSLLVFPDMNVSSMQVEAVKKRNAIIAKYREKIVEITQQLALHKNNHNKIKTKLEQKEAELQFCINKQKEKFKLYHIEANQEKNVLAEQIRALQEKIVHQAGQIQKLVNQHQKNRQIIQEFTSQTKQLVAEKQSLRLQIKNLQQKILELKSVEIKSRATHQSKFSQINEQSQSQILKVKQTLSEYEKRQITFQKTILQKDQAIKKLQNQCNTVIYERDRNEQKSLQLTDKLNSMNDSKKQVQKKLKLLQSQLKDQISLTNQAKQQASNEKAKLQQIRAKYNQTFQLLSDAQMEIQKAKQQIQIGNLTIQSMDGTIKEKQEKYKSLIEKASLQLKQLKQKIITQNSELELKGFMIAQNQLALANLKEQIEEQKADGNKKKQEIIGLNQSIQTLKNTILNHEQAQLNLQTQKDNLQDQNERLKHKASNLQSDLQQNRMIEQILQLKTAQNTKLKEQLELSKKQYEKNIVQFRNQDKNKMVASRYNMKNQQELKRKIKQLQQLLELKHFDLAIERKKWINQGQRDKKQLINQNYDLQQQIQDLQNQFDFQRAQLNKEIQSLGTQCGNLTKLLQDKQEILYAIENLIQQIESGNTSKIKQGKQNVQRLKRRMDEKIRQQSLSKSVDNVDQNNFLVSVRETVLRPEGNSPFKLQEEDYNQNDQFKQIN